MSNDNSHIVLKLEDVHTGYGNVHVICGVNLEVSKGETFGLIGLNGIGKTTLIKTILGLRALSSGSITVLGEIQSELERKENIAFLPERFDPPWFLSGIEFIKFSLQLYKAQQDFDRIYEQASRLGLSKEILSQRVNTYSKGMRQKLGLLASILMPCSLIVLDEPMSGLDPMARALVKEMLMEVREQGRTVFLSSHILADMNEICDRVGVLHDKKLIFVGKPDELKDEGEDKNLERAFLNIISA